MDRWLRQEVSPLLLARRRLDAIPEDTDPLSWWPKQALLASIFPLAKMLLAIPASSAEPERSFSSASFTLDQRRYRVNLAHFRSEHRIRRFLTAGGSSETEEGRNQRLVRVRALLARYGELVQQAQVDD